MDDLACPKCKTTKYRNPALKLMVNVCGHALCENCVELLFVKGSGSCPECNIPLRRNNFRVQQFEDASVEKEVDIRRKVLRDFNKRECDFNDLREYNDYLEEVEEIIFNLAHDLDVEGTRKRIEQYRKDNRVQIAKNKSKLSLDEEVLEELLEREQLVSAFRKKQIQKEELDQKKVKTKNKEALIDELMFSDAPVGEILATHAAMVKKTVAANNEQVKTLPQMQFSSGIKFTRQRDAFLPLPKIDETPLFAYKEPHVDPCGPAAPIADDLQKKGFLNHVRVATELERAGGFVAEIACSRALEEAMCGLFHFPAENVEPRSGSSPMES